MANDTPDESPREIVTNIAIDSGRVMVLWPRPITWIAFDPDAADIFADTLKARAQQIREQVVALTKH
jgi:hypothetical protein